MSIACEGNPLTDGQIGAGDPMLDPTLAEWQAELARYHPLSHEYLEMVHTLGELGIEVPDGRGSSSESLDLPPGFVGSCALDHELEIPAEQFVVTVPPLSKRKPWYVVGGTELATDSGKRVRLVDLRPELADHLGDIAPQESDAARLTSHFFHDLRAFADRLRASNVVRRNGGQGSGPCYTRVVGKKARAYWAPVIVAHSGGAHVLTVARFADCGNDPQDEVRLYRRVFNMTLRHIN